MPCSNHIHKSMLLRGVKLPTRVLDQNDIEGTKSRAARSGRSHGGAPLRGNGGFRGRDSFNYSGSNPTPDHKIRANSYIATITTTKTTTMHHHRQAGNRLHRESQASQEDHLHLPQVHTVLTRTHSPIRRRLALRSTVASISRRCHNSDMMPLTTTGIRTRTMDLLTMDLIVTIDIKEFYSLKTRLQSSECSARRVILGSYE
jgi:hypothetical protein